MTVEQATNELIRLVKMRGVSIDDNALLFMTEKLVFDVLAYLNRDDFPEPLKYTCVDLIVKRIQDNTGDGDGVGGINAPVKSVKQNDTEFTFAVADVNTHGLQDDYDFSTIYNKLNRFRKVRH